MTFIIQTKELHIFLEYKKFLGGFQGHDNDKSHFFNEYLSEFIADTKVKNM